VPKLSHLGRRLRIFERAKCGRGIPIRVARERAHARIDGGRIGRAAREHDRALDLTTHVRPERRRTFALAHNFPHDRMSPHVDPAKMLGMPRDPHRLIFRRRLAIENQRVPVPKITPRRNLDHRISIEAPVARNRREHERLALCR
jgi:hypothetical protein